MLAREARRPRAHGAQRPAAAWRARRRSGASGEPLPRNAGAACSAARAPRAAGSTRSGRCTSATCRAPSPPGARVRAGVEARRIVLEDKRAVGVRCLASSRRRRGRRAPLRGPRAGRWCCAGGAFGTPELLLRSGHRGPQRRARAQPPHPPGVLGRRALRRGGARLGRRDAELLRRRVGGPRAAARGHVHPARLRRPVAAGHRAASTRSAMLAFDRIASTGVHLSDRSAGRVGLAGDGSLRLTYRLTARRGAHARRSGSRAPPSSSSPPARPRSTRRSAGCP